MKNSLKKVLYRVNIFPMLDGLRRFPAILKYICNGLSGIAPSPLKRLVIQAYLDKFKLNSFIETGTFMGDTIAYVAANTAVSCASIELSQEYYELACARFESYKNVKLHHGDSGNIIPSIVAHLSEPSLFWLDGHYSGGNTAQAGIDTPIIAELSAIINHSIKNHVILIDDARCFDGTNGYPQLDELLGFIRHNSIYRAEVSSDIIRLTPSL